MSGAYKWDYTPPSLGSMCVNYAAGLKHCTLNLKVRHGVGRDGRSYVNEFQAHWAGRSRMPGSKSTQDAHWLSEEEPHNINTTSIDAKCFCRRRSVYGIPQKMPGGERAPSPPSMPKYPNAFEGSDVCSMEGVHSTRSRLDSICKYVAQNVLSFHSSPLARTPENCLRCLQICQV